MVAPDLAYLLWPYLGLLAYLLVCMAAGRMVLLELRLTDPDERSSLWLNAFFAIATGLAISMLVLFLLAAFGLLSPWPIVAAHALLLAGALGRGTVRVSPGPEALIMLGLLAWAAMAAIRVPGHFDDTSYHLPLARHLAEQHSLAPFIFLRFPLFPQNMELLFALGLMLGHEVIAQTLATLPLAVMAIGLVGLSDVLLASVVPGFIAAGALLSLGPVVDTLGYAYVDDGLGMFTFAAIVSVVMWERGGRRADGWLVVCGMLGGAAMGCKLFGLIPTALAGVWIVLARRDGRSTLRFILPLLVFGGGWYVRSWLISGDPIHPAGARVFGYYLWNEADVVGAYNQQDTYGVPKHLWNLWLALQTAGAPAIGIALLWAVAIPWASRAMRLLYGFFAAYVLFWLYVTQNPRFLAPAYALGAFFAAAISGQVAAWIGRRLRVPPLPWVRVAAPWFGVTLVGALLVFERSQATGRLTYWQQTVDSRPGISLFVPANTLIPTFGDRMVKVGFANGAYFFRGTAIGDWYGIARYDEFADCKADCGMRSVDTVKALMQKFDSRILLVKTDEFPLDLASYSHDFRVQTQTPEGVVLTLTP